MAKGTKAGQGRNITGGSPAEKLREYQRFPSTLISNLPGMVYRCRNDEEWTMEYVSDGCLGLTGYHPEDLLSNRRISYNQLIYPDDREMVREKIRRTLECDAPYEVTYRIITADGNIKWVLEQGRYVCQEGGGKTVLEGFIADITERKLAEEALRKSEAKLESIFRSAPTGIGVVVNRVLTEANERLCEMTGYAREELLGNSVRMLYSTDEEYQRVGRVKYSLIDQTGTGAVETQWRRKDGRLIDVLLSSSPIDRRNIPAGVTFTALDITRRKRSEEEYSRLASIVMSSDDAIISKRLDGTITSWNRGAERLYGYTAAEAIGRSIDIVVPSERKGEVQDILEKIRHGDRIEHYETERLTKDGRKIFVSVTISPIIDIAGNVTGASTIARDITESKRAEKALKKSQFILAKSQEMAHVGNWAWNVATGEMNASDESFRIFGYRPQKAPIDLEWLYSRTFPDDRAILTRLVDAVSEHGRLERVDYRIVRPDGSVRYVNMVADKIVRSDGGNTTWVYGIIQDITERKHSEMAVEEAKARAELYLDLMGHDINNMNQIALGFLEVTLSEPGLGDRQRDMLSKSLEAIQSSSRLIDNVRKLQQASTVRTGLVETDVGAVLGRVESTYSKVPGCRATIRYNATVPACTVMADELLYDVFSNIVGNAVKHCGREPSILISQEKTGQFGREYCRVAIEDDGPGIRDEMKHLIFERLRRGNTKAKGSGLGLYLVKTLVEGYGGKVWVEDRVPGDYRKGSRFVVILPVISAKNNNEAGKHLYQ